MKMCEILKRKDVGSVGIGAMIVFIAMVLVAGIAASVLVQTANRLEIQAMETGDETTAEVSTGLKICDVEGNKTLRAIGYNTTTDLLWAADYGNTANDNITWRGWHNYTRLHNMTITVAPRAGSYDIDLAQTVVEISNSSRKCILTYLSTEYASQAGTSGVFGTTGAFDGLGPEDFGIIELEDADNSCQQNTPVINRGDKVMLTINLSACFFGLEERCDVWGQVIPEDGAPGLFSFRTPASYTDFIYDLY